MADRTVDVLIMKKIKKVGGKFQRQEMCQQAEAEQNGKITEMKQQTGGRE